MRLYYTENDLHFVSKKKHFKAKLSLQEFIRINEIDFKMKCKKISWSNKVATILFTKYK